MRPSLTPIRITKAKKTEDTPRGTIEDKVKRKVQSVAEAAVRRKVQTDLRAELELVRRRTAQEWAAAKLNKDRVRSLRCLMDKIAAKETAPEELVVGLKLMALMAERLDPLVKAPWPEVDGALSRY
jgi:hypothetical protein